MAGTAAHRSGRVVELDGVRGIAILLVVWEHLASGAWPAMNGIARGTHSAGGLAGVQLFFVLSGFLITRLLLSEFTRTGTICLRAFYARRARRLLPALILVCAVLLVARPGWASGRDVIRALTYTENLSSTRFGQGFPVAVGTGWLGHTWSLAVEEQFYVVWPVLLLLAGRRHRWVLAAAAAVTIGLRFVVGGPAYTLLRWDAIAAGCLLASASWRPPAWAGGVGAAVLLAFAVRGPGVAVFGQWHYLSTIAASVLLIGAAPAIAALRVRPLVHFGRVSYGFYLWHVLLLRIGANPVLEVLLAWLLAVLSFRVVESRFLVRRGTGGEDALTPADAER